MQKDFRFMGTIIFVGNTAFSMYNFRLGVLRVLLSRGYKVIVIAPKDEFSRKLKQEGCEVLDIFVNRKGANFFEDFATFWQLFKYYKNLKPDLIFHYTIKSNIYGTLAAGILRIPSIVITTGLGYAFVRNNLISKIVKLLYKLTLPYARQVWFLNSEDRATFLSNNLVKPNQAVILYGEGVDTNFWTSTSNHTDKNNFIFLLIARMLWDKGVGEFVKAAAILKTKYPHAQFHLLGALDSGNPSGIDPSQIDAWVDDNIVQYLGFCDDVKSYINNASCVVLPSSYREGIPRVLLEAASMAKPIITTNNVGCKEVVNDGQTGFLCAIKDAQDLAIKMEKMMNLTKNERTRMGEAGREKVLKEFDEKIIVAQYLETINQLLHKT